MPVTPPSIDEESQSTKRRTFRPKPWVVAMLVLLGAGGFQGFRTVQFYSRRIAEQSKLANMGVGIQLHCGDWDQRFPDAFHTPHDLQTKAWAYVGEKSAFHSGNPAGGEFVGNAKIEGQRTNDLVDDSVPVLYNPRPWPNGKIGVWFSDGVDSGEMVPNAKFQAWLASPIQHKWDTTNNRPFPNRLPKR